MDEPFYAWYLHETGIPHPGADHIISTGETRQTQVIESLTAPLPAAASLHYQKHITTHVLPQLNLDWLSGVSHCFLIRDPARVVASYANKRADIVIADLGYAIQTTLFRRIVKDSGITPLVIDADRFLQHPDIHLQAMCQHFKVPYYTAMLAWPPGVRETDGPWHTHWYQSVVASTGFMAWSKAIPALTAGHQRIVDQCRPDYDALLSHALSF